MQRGSLPLSIFKYIPLAFVVVATLHDQMLWAGADFLAVLFHLFIWLVLIVGWLFRVGQHIWTQKKLAFKPSSAILPLCLLFVFVCDKTDAPIRILFWTHKRALREALKRPSVPDLDGRRAPQPSIGLLSPIEISKSHGATRILLWESSFIAYGTTVGFVHCPGDKGCTRAKFPQVYVERESSDDTLQLSDDWQAVAITGS